MDRMRSDDEVRVILAVDDTDDVTKLTSTGKIASIIAKRTLDAGGAIRYGITRHQLLLRDDIPYTSHNSSMVFDAKVPEACAKDLHSWAVGIILDNMASSSNPGLCIAQLPSVMSSEDRAFMHMLNLFGRRAKIEFCSIEEALEMASRIPWLTLTSHGGTGAGVVGALAGVGLRLEGNDGRFRDKWDLSALQWDEEQLLSVQSGEVPMGELATKLQAVCNGAVRVIDANGCDLSKDVSVHLEKACKPILRKGLLTIVCDMEDGVAYPRTKDGFEGSAVTSALQKYCEEFEWDNDMEECTGTCECCCNCLHRRWHTSGYSCTLACA